ncbi:MAG TPA: GNAT family N-acetyltransferase [Ramlibacter sp.]|jgi:ribosomal protein S18 acetylase RimI-like enzyme|nr:GNAT family N-acetyltransferase [Ramlibacter sp.]
MNIRRITDADENEINGLADVLVDCVESGASVSFMQPMTRDKALRFWRGVAQSASREERVLLVAEEKGRVLGTVQVVLEQPENQPHRGDVSKMLVLSSQRKRGLGEALMRAAEAAAVECGKTLLVLDTANDAAMRLYERCGWQRVGTIPDYALLPQGGYCDTVYYYKRLV